ncbi:carboxyl-terminal protease [Clostridium sp. CAG:628]|nr:carboxyl-terminal protease [Clostridium sp. CAG:628]
MKKEKEKEKITNMPKEKKIKNKKDKIATFNLIEVIVIIIMTSLVVSVSTGIIVYKNYYKIDKTSSNKDYLKELEYAYNNILNSYVEKVDEKELTNAAIKGMYNYLGDPYTSYLDKDSTDNLMDRLKGEYKGIGVEITTNESGTVVMTVFENSPAEEAGIMVGDIITKVKGVDVNGKTTSEVSNMIKSTNGNVEIEVNRGGITKTLTLKVSTVSIKSVIKNKYDKTGYLRIETFSNTTYKQFKESLETLEKDGIENLIVDVRNNGGGFLNSAVEIAELFVEKGKPIYGLQTKDKKEMYKDTTKEKRDYKVIVLINGGSASASEVLAAALKESYGATLLGTKSYGKGTVQDTSELESGGMIKYTTAYWLTPKGVTINEKGLTPDIEVTGSFKDEMTLENDVELQTAINNLK